MKLSYFPLAATDASKIAFAHLIVQLKRWQFELIDCQQKTDHLASLGAAPISRSDFLKRLSRLVHWDTQAPRSGAWQFDQDLLDDLLGTSP